MELLHEPAPVLLALVDLVEERQRRGGVERVLAATAKAFVVDPWFWASPVRR